MDLLNLLYLTHRQRKIAPTRFAGKATRCARWLMWAVCGRGQGLQIPPHVHTHNAVLVLILICALPAADPSRPNSRCVALHRSRRTPVFDPRVRTMASKSGENLENKSQSDDVRRNNIIAAKGARAIPHPCERARCREHAGSSAPGPRAAVAALLPGPEAA